jgi:hypothetical protein
MQVLKPDLKLSLYFSTVNIEWENSEKENVGRKIPKEGGCVGEDDGVGSSSHSQPQPQLNAKELLNGLE